MAELLQLVFFGLVLGSILTLGAIGLSLTYGILKFAHFAHGDFMTLGAYFALSLVATAQLPILVSIPIAALATLVVALIADRLIYRRLRRTRPVILLIASVGVALILRSAVQIIWGPNVQVYAQGIQLPYVIPFGDGAIRIKPDHLIIMGGALCLVTSLHVFLQHTRVGKAMRAMSDNPDLAQITGIDTEKVVLWTWGIGIALAAVGGIFAGMDSQLHPNLGWQLLLPIFAAAILGGIGRPYGAIAGGMTIGLAQELSTLVIPPEYKPAVSFGIMVLVLIVRPRGIFAGSST